MRRLLAGTTAFFALTVTFLVLPVYAEPVPEAVPVETSVEEVAMGSVSDPAPEAEVQEGTIDPFVGVPDTVPTLSVSATDVAEFSLVGVTWAFDAAVTDTVVQVRVRDLDGTWGMWTEVGTEGVEQAADAETGSFVRGGTAPLWTGPATAVEAELVTRSGAQPTDVQLDLVDPGESEADSSLGSPDIQETADAAVAMPPVFSRAQWGADESLMGWNPQYASTINAATLHHTADTNNYSADQVPAMMRSIYRYHAVSLGWGDIGYNVIVDKFGRLWEGRSGGLASTVVGAHAGGFNTSTFGVSMLGNYDVVDTPQAMIGAVAAIIAWKFSLYNVNPKGTAALTSGGTDKWPKGAAVTLPTIFGHRDTKSTACPGRYGYARLGEIRDRVGAALAGTQLTIAARYSVDQSLQEQLGTKVGGEQTAAGVSWQQYKRGRMYWTPTTGAHVVMGDILTAYLGAGGPAVLGAPTTDEMHAPRQERSVQRLHRWRGRHCLHLLDGVDRSPCGPGPDPRSVEAHGPRDRASGLSRHVGGGGPWRPCQHLPGDGVLDPRQRCGGGARGHRRSVEGPGRLRLGAADQQRDRRQPQLRALQHLLGQPGRLLVPADRCSGRGGTNPRSVGRAWGCHRRTGLSGLQRTGRSERCPVLPLPERNRLLDRGRGARALEGDIARKWTALGGLARGLGVPTTNETLTPDGVGRFNHFAEGASIYWTRKTGAWSVQGRIRDLWAEPGWKLGESRYPTSDERPTGDGRARYTTFQNGRIYWTPSGGAHGVYGSIHSRYVALGAESSRLGLPTSDEYAVPGGRASDFEHGHIAWNARTGATTVSYR